MLDLRKPELSPRSTRIPSRAFRHRLGKFIYVPTFIALLLVMIGTVFSGTTLIFYDVENANLPKWFDLVITNFIVPIGSFYNVYDAESSKHLNIVFLTLIGIVMAIFVKRCSDHNNGFELFVVGSLICAFLAHVIRKVAFTSAAFVGADQTPGVNLSTYGNIGNTKLQPSSCDCCGGTRVGC